MAFGPFAHEVTRLAFMAPPAAVELLRARRRTAPGAPGREDRYEVVVADRPASIEGLLPELRELYESSTAASAFSAPDLLLAWARARHPGRPIIVVAVRAPQGLLAAAIFTVRRVGLARVMLQLGSEPDARVVELPEILTRAGGSQRKAVRLILAWAADPARRMDWVHVSVADDQGWPEGRWAAPTGSLLKTARASVVLRLRAEDWQADLPRVKRNLRESLRRGRNRLNRTGLPWRVVLIDDHDPGWSDALSDLGRLHRERSLLAGPHHPDDLSRPEVRRLLTEAAGESPSTRLEIRRLLLDEEPVAALLSARDELGLWVSASGVDARGWEFSAVTVLAGHAVRDAALAGLPRATFSVGVDEAKLRWSEEIHRYHEFLLVHPRRRSQLLFACYLQLRAFAVSRRLFGH